MRVWKGKVFGPRSAPGFPQDEEAAITLANDPSKDSCADIHIASRQRQKTCFADANRLYLPQRRRLFKVLTIPPGYKMSGFKTQ